ncbi:hypothetical protein [Streptomyces sp. KN37]|uniref:hypothetical protein n=1 Tax=Streptomyces sp. KN37 TaxID=3090667 RepID=UPI002A747BE9|nr:hypothetical protein [Streptomyces sp. KN37]WPO76675.1 hypothetical protein R9806_39255 [Streptomyces sp. KN37]
MDVALAAVDVAAVVFTVREKFSRRHMVTKPGREAPTADRMTYTATFPLPHRWWIAPAPGTPPRESSRYERARVASLAVQNAIRDARIRADTATEATASADSAPADHCDLEGETASAPHAVDHPGRTPP